MITAQQYTKLEERTKKEIAIVHGLFLEACDNRFKGKINGFDISRSIGIANSTYSAFVNHKRISSLRTYLAILSWIQDERVD